MKAGEPMTTPSPDIESLIAAARERHAMFTATIEDGEWNGIELCRCNQPWPCPDRLLIDALVGERETLRKALIVFGHEYDVDGRQEWHSLNCIYRKTWAMGGEDEPACTAARAALGEPNA